MKRNRQFPACLVVGLSIAGMSPIATAQDAKTQPVVTQICPSAIATIMVAKVSCTATLCNIGASSGGLSGFLTNYATRGMAINAASFSSGVGAQLSTALKQTGCFNVLDAATIEETKKDLEALGRVAPPPPRVDYLLRASVTKVEQVLDESGILGFKTVTATSSMVIDTKILSAESGSVNEVGVYESTIERKSSGVDLGIYRSNDQAAKRGTPFADVTSDVLTKTAMGIATKLAANAPLSRAQPTAAPQAPAASAP